MPPKSPSRRAPCIRPRGINEKKEVDKKCVLCDQVVEEQFRVEVGFSHARSFQS